MKRFFVQNIENTVTLCGNEHRHLAKVLRLSVGEEVVLCCGDGYDYIFVIEQIGKNDTQLRLKEKKENECEPRVKLTVYSALTKGDKPELIAQKLTELGASQIVMMTTRYTVAQHSEGRKERVERTCLEAAKQCGRATIPVVRQIDFADMLSELNAYDAVVFPYESATGESLAAFLQKLDLSAVREITVIIGSEGGFSEEEVSELSARGIRPLTLGKRILRADTANIAAAAIVMNALGEYQ